MAYGYMQCELCDDHMSVAVVSITIRTRIDPIVPLDLFTKSTDQSTQLIDSYNQYQGGHEASHKPALCNQPSSR